MLKNALDQAYKEWNRKPFTAIAYGGTGAARALEHLRGIAVELQTVSTHAAVHIGGGDFMTIYPMFGNKPIEEIETNLLPSAKAALDELVWWAKGHHGGARSRSLTISRRPGRIDPWARDRLPNL